MDDKSNVANYKYTDFVEICPLCKDDLLFLPPKMARNYGNINQLVLVKNITNLIHVIDPLSGQTAQMSSVDFWREPFRPVITAARSRFVRYVVLGKEAVIVKQNVSKKAATRKNRSKLALLTVAKEDDLGINDVQFEDKSHVGYLMKAGDIAVGYDLTDVQFVDDDAEAARAAGKLPDVVILRKLYGGVASNEIDASKRRMFKLQKLDADTIEESRARKAKMDKEDDDMDEEDFLREVEADKEMRINMNLYKTEIALKKEAGGEEDENMDDEDDDDQKVKLDELLDGLVLDEESGDKDMGDEFNDGLPWTGGQFVEEGEKAAADGIAYTGRDDAQKVKSKEPAMPIDSFSKQFIGKEFKFI